MKAAVTLDHALKRVVRMREWDSQLIEGVSLGSADQRLINQLYEKRRVIIEEMRDGLRVQSRSWVGVLQLSELRIVIEPKLTGGNRGLIEMLSYASGLDALKRQATTRTLQTADDGHLFNLIALLFAEACERVVRRRLRHDYVVEEERLPVLRGRLLVAEQIRRGFGRIDQLHCRYDDHTSDIPDNQLLAAATTAALPYITHLPTRRHVARLHTILQRACTPHGDFSQPIHYNRLNRHYEPAHQLAQLLLRHLTVDNLLSSGATNSYAFLLDMNLLFEQFVERIVREAVGDVANIEAQSRNRSILWDVDRSRPYKSVRPDLVLEWGGRKTVIDAKYKLYNERDVSSADFYQLFLYALAYDSNPVFLLHPTTENHLTRRRLQARAQAAPNDTNLHVIGLPVKELLRPKSRETYCIALSSMLMSATQSTV